MVVLGKFLLTVVLTFALGVPGSFALTSKHLRIVQKILAEQGRYSVAVDGLWGPRTRRAVEYYIKKKGGRFDGNFSEAVYSAIVGKGSKFTVEYLGEAMPLPDLIPMGGRTGWCRGDNYIHYTQRSITRDVYAKEGPVGLIRSISDVTAQYLFAVNEKLERKKFLRSPGAKLRKLQSKFKLRRPRTDRFHMRRFGIKGFSSDLANVADEGAYSDLDFSGFGPNPAYWQAALLVNVAYFVSLMDRDHLWGGGQRERIIKWGNTLFDQSHRVSGKTKGGSRIPSARRPDTVGIDAAAYVLWGLASGNSEALADGVKDFKWLRKFQQMDGSIQWFLNGKWSDVIGKENNLALQDETLGFLVVAASAAKKAGIDLYSHKHNGVSLLEAVDYHIRLVVEPDTMNNPPRNQNKEFMQMKGDGRLWGWVESYLADFPKNETSNKIWEGIRRNKMYAGYDSATLGKTTCMFRN